MRVRTRLLAGWLVASLCAGAARGADTTYAAVKTILDVPAAAHGTWGILDRDGANRQVERYLSSLAGGEVGTGTASSPQFAIAVDRITFTVCGHDGQGGGRGRNLVRLVDAATGQILRETPAPGSDAMQERAWDVGDLKGRRVRVEVHDGLAEGAFAWLGVGAIDAGNALQVDFSRGMPQGWTFPPPPRRETAELLTGGIPFLRTRLYTVVPPGGGLEAPCGVTAVRLYVLGCTVPGGVPLEVYGDIKIEYRDGSADHVPLMYGFTVEGADKLMSVSAALHLHPSADPFQYYLAITPRPQVVEKLVIKANPSQPIMPRITAITVETAAPLGAALQALPPADLADEEREWIAAHAVSATSPDMDRVMREIRRVHQLDPMPGSAAVPEARFKKHTLDAAFRSEGVAVADFNRDGFLDIAAGNVIYTGPDWTMVPMLGKPRAFAPLGYSDAFLCLADDLTGDGWPDLICVGFPGQATTWLENPGKRGGVWARHKAIEHTGNESPWYADIDGDGRLELVFCAGDRVAAAAPGVDPRALWSIRFISRRGEPADGHGLGVGDLNGDGRMDVLGPRGWWEGPAQPTSEPWTFHPAPFAGEAQLCVLDCDGDGHADVLGSSAHGYGIWWTERTPGGWKRHVIDATLSQTHALHVADIDGDGLMDFVTGKRFWAHNGADPGAAQPSLLVWYALARQDGRPVWTRHVIDDDSGVGLHFAIADLSGNGKMDIVTANKKGVHLFTQ